MLKKVNVLGTEYKIKHVSAEEIAKAMDANIGEYGGFCDAYSKEIAILKPQDVMEGDELSFERWIKEAVRHELVHAFLNESGLKANSEWARNEELVDWIAIQAPKIFKLFEKLEVL